VGEKYVELLKEAVPSLTRAAILASRQQRPAFLEEMQSAGRALRVVLSPPTLIREFADLEPVVTRIARDGNGGLIFPNDAFTVLHRQALVGLVARYRLPAIYATREHVEAGGAKPADLPVEQPTRFELAVNLKAARALGLTMPSSLLVRADHVIDQ
jgi:putative ABC transport system substrate-binding protein